MTQTQSWLEPGAEPHSCVEMTQTILALRVSSAVSSRRGGGSVGEGMLLLLGEQRSASQRL